MSRNPLTENEKAQMVKAYRAGTSTAKMAERFNCSDRTVQRTVKNSMDPKELEERKKQRRKQSSAKPIRCDEEKSHPAPVQIPGKEYMQSSCTSSNGKEQEAFLKLREDLRKDLQEFKSEAEKKREHCLENERQTESTLIDPYLEILGVEIRNPEQLRREYSTSSGKDAGRVDYAVLHENKPIWLIEVKCAGHSLPDELHPQLKRYIIDTEVSFASLTNGIDWHWYKWDDNEKRKPEKTPFLKNDVRHLTDLELDWLAIVRRGLHEPNAQDEARTCKMVNLFVDWIRRLAKKPSEEMLKLALKECDLPVAASKLASEVLPKAFECFISLESQSDADEDSHLQASTEDTTTMSEAVGKTRKLGRELPTHKDESERLTDNENSRMARYRFSHQAWVKVSDATCLMLDVLKWCSKKHIHGDVNYYDTLSRVQVKNKSLSILSKDSNEFYSKKMIDGWHIFNNVNNQEKPEIIDKILAACIKKDGTSPVRGRDLWVEIPNAC